VVVVVEGFWYGWRLMKCGLLRVFRSPCGPVVIIASIRRCMSLFEALKGVVGLFIGREFYLYLNVIL
jgi:hypothetical protein